MAKENSLKVSAKLLLTIFFSSVLLLFSILCIAGCSNDAGESELIFKLSSDKESYYVTGYNFTDERTVTIPETYKNKRVTAIGISAFENCSLLKGITFSRNIKYIHLNAFSGCDSLEEIEIPSATKVDIGAFSNCSSLKKVNIGYGVKLETSAFKDCTSLNTVIVGNGVTEIPGYAFSGCESLMSITLGNDVKTVGMNAFDDCHKLIEIYNYSSLQLRVGSNDYGYIAKYALNIFTSNIKSNIDNSTKDYVFWRSGDYNYLINYTGTDGDITLPDGDYTINSYAFYKNSTIKNVVIPNGVTQIGTWAFRECLSLESISIGEGVSEIGSAAFYGSDKIIEKINGICYVDNWVVDVDDECPATVNLRDGTIGVAHSAFTNAPFEEINMNSELKYVGAWAFNGCKALKKAVLGQEIDTINTYLFYGCENLEEISIGNKIKTICAYAFNSCKKLTTVRFSGELSEFNSISVNMGNEPFTKAEVVTL